MEGFLPAVVALRTTTQVEEWAAPLRAEEAAAVAGAVPRRRTEFAAGRALARAALADLGVGPAAIGVGPRRRPLWPAGVVGSITHCQGFAAVAAALRRDVAAIGIDAEPVTRCLSAGVVERISTESERAAVDELGELGPLLVFSAKEAVYKAWFPMTSRWLGFQDVSLDVSLGGTFAIELGVDDEVGMSSAEGKWILVDGVVLTTAVLRAPGGAP